MSQFSFLFQRIPIFWDRLNQSSIAIGSIAKSLPLGQEPRGEAGRESFAIFCFLNCFYQRSTDNFIYIKWWIWFSMATVLLEPANGQCESRNLVCQYESCSLKSCPLQETRDCTKSDTRVKFGWMEEKWSDGFLFNSYLSHSCCPPLIFVHGPKKMWWVFCVHVASIALPELSNKWQWVRREGRPDQNIYVRVYCCLFGELVSQQGFKMSICKLRTRMTSIKQPHSPVSGINGSWELSAARRAFLSGHLRNVEVPEDLYKQGLS